MNKQEIIKELRQEYQDLRALKKGKILTEYRAGAAGEVRVTEEGVRKQIAHLWNEYKALNPAIKVPEQYHYYVVNTGCAQG